VLQKLEIMYI